MRRVPRVAFVVWAVVSFGGCAAITGLDQITEQQCAPNCGAADGTVDALTDQGVDQFVQGDDSQSAESGDDSTTEASGDGPADTSPPKDTGGDGPKDTGTDTGVDSPVDSPKDSPVEAPVDSGCGATNTLQNCGACGQACSAGGTNGVKPSGAGCTGTTCLYSCNTGFLDCNASVGYDPDGCECNATMASTAACCGTACPIVHSVGTGVTGAVNQNFYDCIPGGTYTSQLATDACAAYFGTSADCGTPGECFNTTTDAGTGDFVVCGQVTPNVSQCYCWEYQGPNNGKVTTATGTFLGQCYCPGSTGTGFATYSYQ